MNFLKSKKRADHFKAKITGSIAAFIGLGLLLLTSCGASEKDELGTFDTPEDALKETHKALSLLSNNVNQGYESVLNINEYEITKNKVFNID